LQVLNKAVASVLPSSLHQGNLIRSCESRDN
jgi:hypothetical protein